MRLIVINRVMRRNAYGSRGYTETMNKDEASLEKNFSALRIFNGNPSQNSIHHLS